MQLCFLKQFFSHILASFPSWEIACSQSIQYLSVHVSPSPVSLYALSLPALLTHCKWLIQSREFYLFLFMEQMPSCDIGLPDLSFNDAYYWIEVAMAYESAITPRWINTSILFFFLSSFSEYARQEIVIFFSVS